MNMTGRLRQIGAAFRVLIILTAILGIAYPLVMTGFAQVVFHDKANGSLVTHNGDATGDPEKAVGSELIGQNFAGARWFRPRPSAPGYDGPASGASNLGPNSSELKRQITERRAAIAKEDGVAPAAVPPDALTAGGSGLDPDISPAYAMIQIDRVATANHLDRAAVARLVRRNTAGRDAGFIGDPHVNVLLLNIDVRKLAAQ